MCIPKATKELITKLIDEHKTEKAHEEIRIKDIKKYNRKSQI